MYAIVCSIRLPDAGMPKISPMWTLCTFQTTTARAGISLPMTRSSTRTVCGSKALKMSTYDFSTCARPFSVRKIGLITTQSSV